MDAQTLPFTEAEGHRFASLAAWQVWRTNRLLDFEELKNEAWVGLYQAARRYDPAVSKPQTYFVLRARGHLLDWLRDLDWCPRLERRRLRETGEEARGFVSLSAEILRGDAEDRKNYSLVGNIAVLSDHIEAADVRDALEKLLSCLFGYERDVFRLYCLEEQTMHQIGEQLGISESRVSRIFSKMLPDVAEKLSRFLARDLFPERREGEEMSKGEKLARGLPLREKAKSACRKKPKSA